ncbi:hypothetical protein M3987_09550 [Rothia kristinae]|nr:hypothetical protein [Rothia kristinae]MCT1358176.1 hypothetical protein [Rothia kristinae]
MTRTSRCGASPWAARENITREVRYRQEFRELSTAVSTTICMMVSACGMPMIPRTTAKGLRTRSPDIGRSQGTMHAMTAMEVR